MQKPAYSYIRFSSDSQSKGDSVRRQVESAERYARDHDLDLDTHSYRDLGVSAFRGKNAVQGKLGTFLSAVDSGIVSTNSVLLVESLDRISRSEVDDALELFLSIIRRGVSLVTLVDGQTYSTETIKRDRGISLIVSILVMMRAHEESATKGERVRAAWKARAAKGGVFTSSWPSWVTRKSGAWVLHGERVEVVQGIFHLYLEGYGMPTIAKMLNDAGIETFGRARYWRVDSIGGILHHHAVYGELQREQCGESPVPGYYPVIVSKLVFDRAALLCRSKFRSRIHFDVCFLFDARGMCEECGGRVTKISGRGFTYRLQCVRAFHRGGCSSPPIGGRGADVAFLQELAAGTVLQAYLDDPKYAAIRAKLVQVDEQVKVLGVERQRLLQLALTRRRAASVEVEIDAIESQLSSLAVQAANYRKAASSDRLSDLAEAKRMSEVMLRDGVPTGEKMALQHQMNALLGRLLTAVSFAAKNRQMNVTFSGGVSVRLHVPRLVGAFNVGNTHYQSRRPAST